MYLQFKRFQLSSFLLILVKLIPDRGAVRTFNNRKIITNKGSTLYSGRYPQKFLQVFLLLFYVTFFIENKYILIYTLFC